MADAAHSTAKRGDAAGVTAALSAGADLQWAGDVNSCTALHWAAHQGSAACVRLARNESSSWTGQHATHVHLSSEAGKSQDTLATGRRSLGLSTLGCFQHAVASSRRRPRVRSRRTVGQRRSLRAARLHGRRHSRRRKPPDTRRWPRRRRSKRSGSDKWCRLRACGSGGCAARAPGLCLGLELSHLLGDIVRAQQARLHQALQLSHALSELVAAAERLSRPVFHGNATAPPKSVCIARARGPEGTRRLSRRAEGARNFLEI